MPHRSAGATPLSLVASVVPPSYPPTRPGLWQPGHHTLGCLRVRPHAVIQVERSVMLRMRMSWEPSQPPRSPRGEGEEGGRNEGWCPLCCDADHLGAFAPSQVNYRGQGEEGWRQTNNPCRSHPLPAARSASPALPSLTGAQQQVPSSPLPPPLHLGDLSPPLLTPLTGAQQQVPSSPCCIPVRPCLLDIL